MLTGVPIPNSGTVRIFGTDVARDPLTAKMKMGVILKNGTVYSDLSAVQNILLTAKFFSMDRFTEERAGDFPQALKRVILQDFAGCLKNGA